MEDHSTIGLVFTTDGTINDIPRSAYALSEEKVILDMQKTGKPFVVVVNSAKKDSSTAQNLKKSIEKKYGVNVVVLDAKNLENGNPIRAIFPGRCFRNEKIDACHENTFFQMEGVMVDKDISISNLIFFMKTMLSEVFQKDIKVRLRPGFFPFVEPGFELDISCLICGGEGCPSCKHSGWLELCPCGMIHPEVLKAGGIDPEEYTGFAFGLGLTRLAMMKYGIKDIRILNSGNLKSLSQFIGK